MIVVLYLEITQIGIMYVEIAQIGIIITLEIHLLCERKILVIN